MNINQLVGDQLRDLRGAWNYSQLGFAEAVTERTGVSMSRTTVVRIERGERAVTLPELAAFALVLEVPPAALVTPIDRGRDVVDVAPEGLTTEVSRTYFWWIGLTPPSDPDGRLLDGSHRAEPKHRQLYEAALRRHVTQGVFLEARRKLTGLESLRELAEDADNLQAPGAEDFERARARVDWHARTFVEAIRSANSAGLPPYRVSPELWPDLARSVGRDDPVGWAQDEGIEAYDREVER